MNAPFAFPQFAPAPDDGPMLLPLEEIRANAARAAILTKDNINMLLTGEQEAADHARLIAPTTHTPPVPAPVKTLNTKAMTVRLITRKPTTSRKDEEAEKVAQAALGDFGINASTKLFKDNANPVRHLLNEASAVYQYHKQHTLPYVDRGPRLLPVVMYEEYRDSMRALVNDVQNKLAAVMPHYDAYVQQDVDFRNGSTTTGRAKVSDYPTAEQFKTAFGLDFTFAPLPDNSHWLFDIDEEDKIALEVQKMDVYHTCLADLHSRIMTPLEELIDVLKVQPGTDEVTGKRVGIFRDTKVTNLTDALANVKALSLGDEGVTAACDLLGAALPRQITENIDVLRESPVVRSAAARKLEEVASKMGAFFGQDA
jgi:hypothetical protein